jgi:hypothetical protein
LATLGGRRPLKLSRPEIREIEGHLQQALKLRRQPHYLLFWAFLKYDFYVLNGLKVGDPTWEDLLSQALADRPVDGSELRRLLEYLPPSTNNPVLRKIAETVQSAVG